MTRLLFAFLTLCLLAGCSPQSTSAPPPVAMTPAAPIADAAPVVEQMQAAVAAAGVPAAVALREAVEATLPSPGAVAIPVSVAMAPVSAGPILSAAGIAHVVRWEVTSEAHYTRALRWPIWPRGASGVTWCIGYDGGHQTARDIRADWREHPQVDRLAQTSGITGTAARDALVRFRDIETAFEPCVAVFRDASAPAYMRSTQRAYGDLLAEQPQGVIDALFGLTYNRGGSMRGNRNLEKRVIRDKCLPAHDRACVAAQLRAMKRLWPDVPGLQGRRESEARLAEGRA